MKVIVQLNIQLFLNIEERKFEDYLSSYFEKLDCKKTIKITQGLHKLLKEFEKTEYTPVSKLEELKELKDIQKLTAQQSVLKQQKKWGFSKILLPQFLITTQILTTQT